MPWWLVRGKFLGRGATLQREGEAFVVVPGLPAPKGGRGRLEVGEALPDRPAQAPPPSLTPEQRAFLLQQLQQPAANPGLEASRGMLRGLCNSQGGDYTPDGQCLRPQLPPPQLPARLPSYQCQQIGNTTNCTPY